SYSSSTSVSTVGYCNANATTTNNAAVVGGAIGVVFAVLFTHAKKRRSTRMTPVRSIPRTNVTTNERPNIQLNTLSSSPQRSQAQQQPPQYNASPTIASNYPPPPAFPPNVPTGTSHGGYYVYVPPGMALPPSSHFYPYPVATLQQTPKDEGEKSEANADSIRQPEPPRYDELFGSTAFFEVIFHIDCTNRKHIGFETHFLNLLYTQHKKHVNKNYKIGKFSHSH
uniref:Uncharacterized protein n=1 Tax=Amphimedon queenslandica TaxID=400682 RepID=A0A1X7TV31_AMPQE